MPCAIRPACSWAAPSDRRVSAAWPGDFPVVFLKLTGYKPSFQNTNRYGNSKVKFRPSSVAGKAGRIYYQVAHRGRIRQIATRFRIQTGQWDFPAQRLATPATEEEALVRQCIDSDLAALAGIIRRLEAAARPYDADEVVRLFVAPQHRETILAYMRRQIEHLNSCRRSARTQLPSGP